ncbi:thermonuclease family protein [Candidatus Solirubrobacter pratensis]|uniref:thermonuclease family protein n=1 Tax=Candidatus Solirubrobacter pratensis TaxID=1298857 RepID=UPI000683E658|nr:thermonuclease family protein [Candidatus Solirubrobacter pratensis]
MHKLAIAAIAIALLALAGGKVAGTLRASDGATVVRVVDGDTVVVRAGGREERVRYIGVDTPESVKPGTRVQCFGKAAAAANRRLVAGERVRLVGDAEARDRYGRRLAYVYRTRDGLFVNAELVRRGYAKPLMIRPNVAHAAELRRLAVSARRARLGLWSRC